MEINIPVQNFVQEGLWHLGTVIAQLHGNLNPCENNACRYSNRVFEMNAYCWIEPQSFNFKCGQFYVKWYKYLGRGTYQSKALSKEEWEAIFSECLNYIIQFNKI